MTPLEISILLHYHYSAEDYQQGDFATQAVREAMDKFRDQEELLEFHVGSKRRTYRLTPRGEAFIKAILALPLPVCVWVIPNGVLAE